MKRAEVKLEKGTSEHRTPLSLKFFDRNADKINMRKGFKRSAFRFYVKAQVWVFTLNEKRPFTFILIIAISATITFKLKNSWREREPASSPFFYDYYQPKDRMMLPEYNQSIYDRAD